MVNTVWHIELASTFHYEVSVWSLFFTLSLSLCSLTNLRSQSEFCPTCPAADSTCRIGPKTADGVWLHWTHQQNYNLPMLKNHPTLFDGRSLAQCVKTLNVPAFAFLSNVCLFHWPIRQKNVTTYFSQSAIQLCPGGCWMRKRFSNKTLTLFSFFSTPFSAPSNAALMFPL